MECSNVNASTICKFDEYMKSYILLFTQFLAISLKLFVSWESFIKKSSCFLLYSFNGHNHDSIVSNTVFLVGRFCGVYGNPNECAGMHMHPAVYACIYFLEKIPGLLIRNETRIVYGLIILSTLLCSSRIP